MSIAMPNFGADWAHCCRDMAIFRVFNMAAVSHFGFVIRVFKPFTMMPSKTLIVYVTWPRNSFQLWFVIRGLGLATVNPSIKIEALSPPITTL